MGTSTERGHCQRQSPAKTWLRAATNAAAAWVLGHPGLHLGDELRSAGTPRKRWDGTPRSSFVLPMFRACRLDVSSSDGFAADLVRFERERPPAALPGGFWRRCVPLPSCQNRRAFSILSACPAQPSAVVCDKEC